MKNKLLKRLAINICILSMISSSSVMANTKVIEQSNLEELSSNNINLKNKFENMTDNELNQYINDIANTSNENISTHTTVMVATENLKQAWLAAAQIARNNGYPCAASLVEFSVNNYKYAETSGLIGNKILSTSTYKNYINNIKNNSSSSISGYMTFDKSVNSDLFYALHNVNINTQKMGIGQYITMNVKITDTFDFAYDNNYDSLFTSLVNNWAWLCQQQHVLNKIPVEINFLDNL